MVTNQCMLYSFSYFIAVSMTVKLENGLSRDLCDPWMLTGRHGDPNVNEAVILVDC